MKIVVKLRNLNVSSITQGAWSSVILSQTQWFTGKLIHFDACMWRMQTSKSNNNNKTLVLSSICGALKTEVFYASAFSLVQSF